MTQHITGLQLPQGIIFVILGFIPNGIWTNRRKPENNQGFFYYSLLLLFTFDFLYIGLLLYSKFVCEGKNEDSSLCIFTNPPKLREDGLPDVEPIRTSLFMVALNVVIVSMNVQIKRGVLSEILHNLQFFDTNYRNKKSIMGNWTRCIYPVIAIIMVNDCRGFDFWHVTKNICRIYITSLLELFSILEIEIGSRYYALNTNLSKYENWDKPFLVKYLDSNVEHLKREHLLMVQETRILHRLLGDTIQLANSFLGLQLFFCFALVSHEVSFLPGFAIAKINETVTDLGLFRMLWMASSMIVVNCIVLYPISVVWNAHKTTKEANKTLEILTSVLNSKQLPAGYYKQVKCLLLQLPHHCFRFTVLGMFDLRPPLLVKMLSLYSAYCLLVYQLKSTSN